MSQSSRIASMFIGGRRFGYLMAVVAAQFRVGCGCYGIGAMRGGAW